MTDVLWKKRQNDLRNGMFEGFIVGQMERIKFISPNARLRTSRGYPKEDGIGLLE